MDKLRNDTRLMVRIVRMPDYFRSQNPISFHIDKGIERTSAKMGTQQSIETRTIFRSQCNFLHLFTSYFLKWYGNFSLSNCFSISLKPTYSLQRWAISLRALVASEFGWAITNGIPLSQSITISGSMGIFPKKGIFRSRAAFSPPPILKRGISLWQ